MKRVITIHGWAGDAKSNWFPWLQSELEKRGIEVFNFTMPNSKHPTQDVWLDYLNKNLNDVDEDTFFVGHSLGGITILRYLEGLSSEVKIGGIVLVASFSVPIGYPEPDGFCQSFVNFEKVKRMVGDRVALIHSDNDNYVSNETGKHLHENLGGKQIVIHGGGHLTSNDGYVEFPEVLDALTSLGLGV
jgi:predicted alpha/beta hydrolase family esterase